MKINEIKINKRNPRHVKDYRFERLKKSIREFPKMMKLRPIVIDDEGNILGGNLRYLAMVEMGFKEIPDEWVVKASELVEEEKKRFIIADNVEFGEFDYDMLANEWDMEELQDWGVDVPKMPNIDNLDNNIKEINTEENLEVKNKCPKCGFEW